MSNFFQDIEKDIGQVEDDLLGPTYKYYEKIASPSQIGMSSEASLSALTKNVSGIIDYVELLVSGSGKGSLTGKPLGDQFFLQTGAKCKDTKSGDIKTRYLYVNNVPTGNIPFISAGMGMDFPEFKGLIPSVLQDMENMNPFSVFKGFMTGATPDCQEITMETTPSSINNNAPKQTEFVTLGDIKEMDPCSFTLMNKTNPVTNQKCREAFSTMNNMKKQNDPVYTMYLLSIYVLGMYILYKFIIRNK
jgi:hypothetical protein